jgi:hypothetical protein
MLEQNYLIIQNNVVTNIVLWNGDIATWTPPADSIQLVEKDTALMLWSPVFETEPTTEKQVLVDWVLTQQAGFIGIGFTWDGSVCTTNEPKPAIPTV